MAFYESVVIARPELTENQIDTLINNFSEIPDLAKSLIN